MKTINFIMGGKLGDFIHSLFAVKNICKKHETKADIYLYDIGWEFGLENTIEALRPILLKQEYINSVSILTDYYLDPNQTSENNSPTQVFNKKLVSEGYIELGNWIRSPLLYKACFTEIYSSTFNFIIPEKNDYGWIRYDETLPQITDAVLIHQRYNPNRINDTFPYTDIINTFKNKIFFIANRDEDYEMFKYKHLVPFLKISTIRDWFTYINSCRILISNLTGPAAIAHALDKERIIELPNTPDCMHCIGEEKYSNNVRWYFNNNVKF